MIPSPDLAGWYPIRPDLAPRLPAVRGQVHHALQLPSALGISLLPSAADDAHTNLGWVPSLQALVSRVVPSPRGGLQLGLRVSDLALLHVVDGALVRAFPLHGLSLAGAVDVARAAVASCGIAGGRFTTRRHFELPPDPVAAGAPFDASPRDELHEIAACLANADRLLKRVSVERGGSEVRLWPHHADIATLCTIAEGRTTGAGLALGDALCEEPYFYVNLYPASADVTRHPLAGGGHWHTAGWLGAMLPLSSIDRDPARQAAQALAFLDSALDATMQSLTS